MPGRSEVKRRLISGVVRDNLHVLRRLPPSGVGHHARTREGLWRALALAVVPATVFLVVYALSGPRGAAESPRTAPPAGSADAAPAPGPVAPVALALGVQRIVVDPGHGGVDVGAVGAAGLVEEKEITLDVARRLATFLRQARFEVALTRQGDDTVPLRQRVSFANTERADLFVSIHVNAVTSQACRAIETYHVGPSTDASAEALAGQENHASGYRLADFRRLLEGVYTHVRRAESTRLAELVHGQLVTELGRVNPDLRDKGVRAAPFLVLVATESPGILAEVGCLSNDEEARRLTDGAYRQKIAWGLYLGIRDYADARNRTAGAGHATGSH